MTALPLPPGKIQFLDSTGVPLVGGTIGYYEPATLTPKDTWQDYDAGILNDNPLTLNARGEAIVWGSGRYRMIVKDANGNLIWDRETAVLTQRPYEAGLSVAGTFAANDELARWYITAPLGVTFADNLAGSFGGASPNPSAQTVFDVKRNATTLIGALTVSTGGVMVITGLISPIDFAEGDFVSWHVQSGGANGITRIAATHRGVVDE